MGGNADYVKPAALDFWAIVCLPKSQAIIKRFKSDSITVRFGNVLSSPSWTDYSFKKLKRSKIIDQKNKFTPFNILY
jgi:hypothetical protein